MARYSGPGSNPTFWSRTESRAGSPPPPYSPPGSKTSTAPPSYRSASPRAHEQTSLLGRRERVTVSWGTYTREKWEEGWHLSWGTSKREAREGWRRERRPRALGINGLDHLLACFMRLIAAICFIGVISFMLYLGWNLLRRIDLGGLWPAPPPPPPTYSVAIIGG